ncbi:DUF7824 domain-containing protein [Streptomyces sp. NPDC001288]|uniref:DUF7824 domain-containing protein n=1 Tax=Streptomyces sp. NPDC001297 TaxID=3364559 RepID=UPI0036C8D4FA
MNDFNSWLAGFLEEDSEAGEFARAVAAARGWPNRPNTDHYAYLFAMYDLTWERDEHPGSKPLDRVWPRYLRDRLGPAAVPPDLTGVARQLAVALESGSRDEVKQLSLGTELEPGQRDLLLSRALSVHQARNSSDSLQWEAEVGDPDRVDRVARMRMFAVMWHPDPAQAAMVLPSSGLDHETVADVLRFKDQSWWSGFVRHLSPDHFDLVYFLDRRLGIGAEPASDYVEHWFIDHAARMTSAGEPDEAIAERMHADPHAARFLSALPAVLARGRYVLGQRGYHWDRRGVTFVRSAAERILSVAIAEGFVELPAIVEAMAEGIRASDRDWEIAEYVGLVEYLSLSEEEFAPLAELWPGVSLRAERMDRKLLARAVRGLAGSGRLADGQVAEWLCALREGQLGVAANAVVALGALADDRSRVTDEAVAEVLAVGTDGASGKAAAAVGCVQAFWEAGRLAPERLAEWAGVVLFRPERPLANAVIRLLGRVLRGNAGLAGLLVPPLGAAFAHSSPDTQEKALVLAGQYAGSLDEASRGLVAEATGDLPAVLRQRAAGVFGAPDVPSGAEGAHAQADVLPEPEPVVPLTAPIEDVQDAAAQLGVVLGARVAQPILFERVFDALVRLAHSHRQELARAVDPVLRSHRHRVVTPDGRVEVSLVAQAVTRPARLADERHGVSGYLETHAECGHRVFDAVVAARLEEVAHRIEAGDVLPFLLATPSLSTGEIEVPVLLERLAEYRRLGVRAGDADLDQALLRLRPDPAARPAAAEDLGTPEGHRLAQWMTGGYFPEPGYERGVELPFHYPEDPAAAVGYPRGYSLAALEAAVVEFNSARPRPFEFGTEHPHWVVPDPAKSQWYNFEPAFVRIGLGGVTDRLEGFSPAFRDLGAAHPVRQDHCGWAPESQTWHRALPLWLGIAPAHPDLVASRTLEAFARGAEVDRPCAATFLPALAETPGPAGPAVHLALAYGTGASKAPERLAAADGLLILAGNGTLDIDRLGHDIVELTRLDALKPKRITDTLRTAATAAPATVYALLAAVIPHLLPRDGRAPRAGLADLLTLAADCAEAAPGRPPVDGVRELAQRRGNSLLVKTARRLRDTTMATTASAGTDG